MYKKIFTALVLLVFSIVSEMSVVHALDMQGIGMWHVGLHSMERGDVLSVFCESWTDFEKNERPSECLNSPAPDTIVPERIRAEKEWTWKTESSVFWIDPSRHLIILSDRASSAMVLDAAPKHRGSYADLVGIVKSLN